MIIEGIRKFISGCQPKPVAWWELLIMRILFAGVVYLTLPEAGQIYATQKVPNGIANFLDLTFLAKDGVYPALKIALVIALAVYACGLSLPLVLPFILVSHVMVRTLFNSQGWIHHGVQMVSLALLAQTLVVLTFAIYRLRHGRPFPFQPGLSAGSYFLFYTQMAIVSIYVVSVVSKVDRSDGHWFSKSHYIGLHVVKAERDRYYGKLEAPEPGDVPAARLMLAHPNVTRVFLGAGVLLEFFAFIALYGRGAAALIALALIGFHRSIAALMSIYFHFNEMLLVIFLINIPFWLVWLAKKISNHRSDTAAAALPANPST